MASVWVARFSSYLEKLVNSKGSPILLDIDPSIRAVIELQTGVEDRYLQGWQRFAWNPFVTGGAGQNGAVMLRNPNGSNVLAVLERVAVGSTGGAADSPLLQRQTNVVDLTTVVALTTNRVPDSRQLSAPSLIASTSTNAAQLTTTMMRTSYAANTFADFIQNPNQELPMLPGEAIQVFDPTVAVTMNVVLMWRERALQQSELT